MLILTNKVDESKIFTIQKVDATNNGKTQKMFVIRFYSSEFPAEAYLIGQILLNPQRTLGLERLLEKLRKENKEDFKDTFEPENKNVSSIKELLEDDK